MPPGVGKRRLSMLEWAPIETNPPRRGGPLCPPAQENITGGFCGDVCLAVTGVRLLGGCIPCVPMPPGVMKRLLCVCFGLHDGPF